MTIYMTDKQYNLFLRCMDAMEDFYACKFDKICDIVGNMNHADTNAIENAKIYMQNMAKEGVVLPAEQVKKAARYAADVAQCAKSVLLQSPEIGKESLFTKEFVMDSKENMRWIKDILDTYSRLLIGQFYVIFEQLDIPLEEDTYARYLTYRRNGKLALRARNLLIPTVGDSDLNSWNASLGISNQNTCEESKLAYEMYKVFTYTNTFASQYILRLTGEPLMIMT